MRKIVMLVIGIIFVAYLLLWVWWFFIQGNNVSMVFTGLANLGGATAQKQTTENGEEWVFDTEGAGGLGKAGSIVARGGGLVDFLFFLLCLTSFFIIDRFVVHGQAKGKMSTTKFMEELVAHLKSRKIDDAIKLCDRQKGTYGRYVKAGLSTYKIIPESDKSNPTKVKGELEDAFSEANAIEAFQLEQRLIFIATIASIATMTGLLGTVVGMIRSFAALSSKGRPDPNQLATGISEALINTAGGLTVAIISIIFYNYFVNRVDSFNFNMEEFSSEVITTLTGK
jgi:biopolymer transport protein ExbB